MIGQVQRDEGKGVLYISVLCIASQVMSGCGRLLVCPCDVACCLPSVMHHSEATCTPRRDTMFIVI